MLELKFFKHTYKNNGEIFLYFIFLIKTFNK